MLVILVIAMTVIAILGAAFVSMVSSKQQGFTLLLNGQRATMIARAGLEWAIRFASEGNIVKGSNMPFDPDNPNEGSFSTKYDEKTDVLTVDGTYQGTTQRITLSNFRRYSKIPDVSFALSMDSFKPVESTTGQSVAVDKTAGIIHLGLKTHNTAGAVWYGGDIAEKCTNGVCNFGSGFRAYFVFQYAPGSTGDGFTFAITSGNNNNNTATSIGGDSQMGELMAYGGDSRSYVRYDDGLDYITSFLDGAGKGLRPPKFAVEFDIYPNASCPDDTCGSNNRCDPSNEQHMAYVFWGDDNRIGCKDTYTRWMSSFSFPANTVVVHGKTDLYRSLGDLTTGTTEPSWPSGKGSTVEESGVYWKECSWRASTDYTWGNIVAPSYSYISTTANRFFFWESEFWSVYKTGESEPTWTDCVYFPDKCPDNNATWQNAFYYGVPRVNYATNSRTYDDNKHTTDTGTNAGDSTAKTGPTNRRPSTPATSSDSYYTIPANPSAWLANAANPSAVNHTYAYRMEVVRNSTAGTYQIKSWIKTCNPSWSASTAYSVNDLIRPTASNEYYNKCYYLALNAGTSGITQPGWSETGTVTDGTVKWKPVCTWKTSHEYAVDELIRPTASNGYFYTARTAGTSSAAEPTWPEKGRVTDGTVTWLPYPVGICNKYTNGTLGDVQSDYTADSPALNRTITLDSTYNDLFSKFLFGWTTASGGATQRADVWKFRMTFKP